MMRRAGIALGGVGFYGGCYMTYRFFEKPQLDKDFTGAVTQKKIQRFNSLVNRGDDPEKVRTRSEMVKALKGGEPFDVIIVGGGCTGAGAALDAQTRGLKTACIERGDFSNETSSRSSKLIWGGFKYLQVPSSPHTLTLPPTHAPPPLALGAAAGADSGRPVPRSLPSPARHL